MFEFKVTIYNGLRQNAPYCDPWNVNSNREWLIVQNTKHSRTIKWLTSIWWTEHAEHKLQLTKMCNVYRMNDLKIFVALVVSKSLNESIQSRSVIMQKIED